MVRYEGAALILCAFVMDMIDSKDRKQRLTAFVYAALASVPLAMWMLGTVLSWQAAGPTHYLNIFGKEYTSQFVGGVEKRTGFVKHANILWNVGFYHLFTPIPNIKSTFLNANKLIVFASFLFGSVYGLYKRQWNILVLLLFLLPYFWIHAKYPYPHGRFHATIFAIVMLICIYGLCSFWKLVKDKLPKSVTVISKIIVLIAASTWVLILFGKLSKITDLYKVNVSLLYIAILVTLIALIAEHFACKRKLLTDFVVLALMTLMITSNQFGVAGAVGNVKRDIEFKYLLDWYKDNAKKGEKLVTTVPSILRIMAPQYKDCFIHTDSFEANDPNDFTAECYKRNITYVAWDSKIGLSPTDHYYKYWKVANIAPLIAGKDVGPYQFIAQIAVVNQKRYINLYRLRYPPPQVK
jgi:hypothetical protein